MVIETKKRCPFDASALDRSKKITKRRRAVPVVDDFMNLEVSHPYGVLPGGNRFTTAVRSVLHNSSSPSFVLSKHEEVCYHILSFCEGEDLARLAQCCRFLYAACHQPELWRDLVLRWLATVKDEKEKVLLTMHPTWKDTHVNLVRGTTGKSSIPPHVPMSVSGVYSDYYYRLHSCRTFCIPKQWLEEQSDPDDCRTLPFSYVPHVPYSEMTSQRFYRDFEDVNRPVVIGQAAMNWKARRKWNHSIVVDDVESYLWEQTQGHDFRATSGAAPLSAQFTFQAYQQYCHWDPAVLEEAPLYLFDRTALQPNSPLWQDYHPDLQRSCPYWDSTVCPQHDLFALLGEGRRPDHTWRKYPPLGHQDAVLTTRKYF